MPTLQLPFPLNIPVFQYANIPLLLFESSLESIVRINHQILGQASVTEYLDGCRLRIHFIKERAIAPGSFTMPPLIYNEQGIPAGVISWCKPQMILIELVVQ